MGAEPDIQQVGRRVGGDLPQATLNLFTDMGVLPGVVELGGGLTRPSPLTDSSPPTLTITSPTTSFSSSLLVSGQATDLGGEVAAVEYSLSSAPHSWHPANFSREGEVS